MEEWSFCLFCGVLMLWLLMNFHFYHITLDYFAYLEEKMQDVNTIFVNAVGRTEGVVSSGEEFVFI